MEQPGQSTTTELTKPDAVAASMVDLASYRESKKDAPSPVEARTETPAPVEADSIDPDEQAEIDKIAPPIKDETPQQKAARTRDYRERGRKGLVSRLGNERDAARAELARLRQQLAQTPAPPAGATPATPSPVPTASVGDPSDPEPTYDSFLKAHPDHPDPYAGFLREQGKWDRRQETRQADQQARAASATSAVQQAQRVYQQRVETVRQAHPNYYDVVDPFVQAAKGHPLSPFITEAILGSERGPELLFHLAHNRDAAKAVYTQPSPTLALKQLGLIEAALPNATQSQAASTPVVLPPAPITPVGGSALPSAGDPTANLAAWRKSKLGQSRRSA